MKKRKLAFDFGASSGRAVIGTFDGETITLEEIHRFENIPVKICDTLYWDLPRLFNEIKQGIILAEKNGGFDSIGIDTWGVDFALLDIDGHIMECPVNYRDKRTEGLLDEAFKLIDKNEFYNITGNQFMEINTAFQLLSINMKRRYMLESADCMLMMPDLFNYMLTGVKKTELSIASTTQLLDMKKGCWSEKVRKSLALPSKIFTEIVSSGTTVGKLNHDICSELNVSECSVVAVCGHDTQCAVAAVPSDENDFIFISCGTWSLFGTEVSEPIINSRSQKHNLTNETGYNGRITFLKNIIGLWLIQESRRQFRRDGHELSFEELEKLAHKEPPFMCFIDTDAAEFVPVGNIPLRVKNYCSESGQHIPDSIGAVMRCIYESLAMKYRKTLDEINECTGKSYNKIHLIGGGARDDMLCQMTADACNCEVYAGPTEATAYGNIAIQLIADKSIPNISAARKIIAESEKVKIFYPSNSTQWNNAYLQYKKIVM